MEEATGSLSEALGIPFQLRLKKCNYCKEEKPISEFPKHRHHFDGYDFRCRPCIRIRSRLVAKLKKNAPPKPDVCDCCKKPAYNGNERKMINFVCDHDPVTGNFRGWLCNHCNLAIGHFGDNIEGVQKAIEYLKRTTS